MNAKDILFALNKAKTELIIFAGAFIVRIGYYMISGVKMGKDASYYIKAAQLLQQSHFNFLELYRNGYGFYYWLYPTILALCKLHFPAVVVLQIILQSIAAVLIYLIAKKVFSRSIGLMAATVFIFFWEILLWDVYMLTDSIYLFIVILTAFFALQVTYRPSKRSWFLFGVSAVLVVLGRPSFFPLLAAIMLFVFWRSKLVFKVMVSIVVIVILCFSVNSAINQESTQGIGWVAWVHHSYSLFQKGTLINHRPDMSVTADWDNYLSLHNVSIFARILAARGFLYWFSFAPKFSLAHKLLNVFVLVPTVLFGAGGVCYSLKKISDEKRRRMISVKPR